MEVTGLAFAGIVFGGLMAPGAILAHAALDTVTPADQSTVVAPPGEVVMTFTEPLDPAKSSIKLVDANGKVVAEGSTVDTGSPETMRLALPPARSARCSANSSVAMASRGPLYKRRSFTFPRWARPSDG